MKQYLLDTNLVSAYLLGVPFALNLVAPWIRAQEAATSILVYAEVNEHLLRFPNYRTLYHSLKDLLDEVTAYPLTVRALDRYGQIRRQLRPVNQLIGDIDTLIAATALTRNLTVVTADTDFQRVPGLAVHLVPRQLLQR